MTVRRLDKMASTLTEMFGYTEVSRSEEEAIFQSIKGEAFGEIVVKYLDGPTEKPGRGSIHHLAIRVKNDAELAYWEEQVIQRGFQSSGIIDRFILKAYISANQTESYLKLRQMDQDLQLMEMWNI